MFSISERTAGDITSLDLSGKITIGEGSVQLREHRRSHTTDQELFPSTEIALASKEVRDAQDLR